jgi:anti-anti-sigma regulatory factor
VTTAGVVLTGVLEAIVFAGGCRSWTSHAAARAPTTPSSDGSNVSTATGTFPCIVTRRSRPAWSSTASTIACSRQRDLYVKARVSEAVRAARTPTRWVVFDAGGMSHIDAAGLAVLEELAHSLRDRGIGLAFARLKQPMRERLSRTRLDEWIGEHAHPTVRAAVDACTRQGG